MSELFREIQEDIRAERMQKLWNNFGKVMVRVSLAILVGTVAAVLWQNYRQSTATEQTAQLMKGIDRLNIEDYKDAIATFDAIKGNPYARLAALQKARAYAALGDEEGVKKTYQALAADGDDDEPFVALGKLLAAEDNGAPMTASEESSPFYHLQVERRAWQLLAGGKKDEAVKQFVSLRDNEKTPFSLRRRAAEVLAYLAPLDAGTKGSANE